MRIAVLIVALLVAAEATADAGDLRFESRVDESLGQDRANALALQGRRLFVAGQSDTLGAGSDWRLRALDAKTGALLWDDLHDRGGDEEALTLAVQGSRLFAAGVATGVSGDDWLLRAHDAKTGSFLWEDRVDHGGTDTPGPLAVSGRRVFVGGQAENAVDPNSGPDWLVRALDARTGALLWQDVRGGAGNDRVRALLAKGSRVVVVGQQGDAIDPNSAADWVVRVLNATTGSLEWEDIHDGGAGDSPRGAALKGRRLYVVGQSAQAVDPNSATDWLVRAYDVKSGALLWSVAHDEAMGADQARRVIARGRQLVVVGHTTDALGSSGRDWTVRVLDAKTGALQWDDVFDSALLDDQATQLAAAGKHLFVGGVSENAVHPASADDWVIRSYHMTSGAVVWQHEVNGGTNNDRINGGTAASALLTARGLVYAAGFLRDTVAPDTRRDWLVRALDAR